jgi:hypothetical protein
MATDSYQEVVIRRNADTGVMVVIGPFEGTRAAPAFVKEKGLTNAIIVTLHAPEEYQASAQ